MKKKAEGDFSELESQIDTSNRVNADQAKTIKKLQQQIKELQSMLDDEQRAREDGRDVVSRSERRCTDLAQELDEFKMAFEQVKDYRTFDYVVSSAFLCILTFHSSSNI